VLQIERTIGTLIKVDGTNLVIRVRHSNATNDVSVATDPQTEFRVNGPPGRITDLKPGMQVIAMRRPALRGRQGRLNVTATDPELEATVVRAGVTNLVLKAIETGSDPREVSLTVNETTRIQMAGSDTNGLTLAPTFAKLEDLKPGMKVKVWPPTGTARRIMAIPLPGSIPSATPAAEPAK
jgi:hypothetical protein